jgi:hypothetical protein
MKSFLQFLSEETQEIHHLPDGGRVYHTQVGEHAVQTHFIPRQSDKGTKDYDIHFIRKTAGSRGSGFSRQGIGVMSVEDRLKAINSVKKAVKHFVDSEKPDSLVASSNTKHKADWSHEMLNRLGKTSGSVVRRGNEVSLMFDSGYKKNTEEE